MRRPLLSAAAEEDGMAGESGEAGEAESELAEISRVVEAGDATEAIPVTDDNVVTGAGESAGAGSRDDASVAES